MARRGYATLARPVRLRSVLKYLGELSLSLSGMAAVPGVIALTAGWGEAALRFAIATGLLVGIGWPLTRLRAESDIRVNEALVITSAIFILGSVVMTWPLMVGGIDLHDAFFEAVSSITTTGLSTIPADTELPAVHLFTRSWMQWYGGMVIIVVAVGLLLPPGSVSKNFAQSDAMPEGFVGSARLRARQLLAIYVTLTALGILILWALGMRLFDAVCHTLTGLSTGGFSTHWESLGYYDELTIQVAVMVLCLLGALSFSLYHRVLHGTWHELFADSASRMLLFSLLACTAFTGLFMALSQRFAWEEIATNAPLMALSAQATAGFSTLSVPDLDEATKATLMVTMFIGGDAGSTAGGIKAVRLLIIVRLIQLMIQRVTLPQHAVVQLRVYGNKVDEAQFERIVGTIALFCFTILLSWLAFLAYGYPPLDSLFDVVSATTTTGLSAGVAGPALPIFLKLVLCLDMLMGRLEIVALLVLFYPATWLGKRGMM